jgi:23S rRNA pseudouridine1911/1915/1917 synthase
MAKEPKGSKNGNENMSCGENQQTRIEFQPGQLLKFNVGNNLKNRRLDKYLQGRFNQFSRSRIQKLIKEQGVNVNGKPAKTSHNLNPGDCIELTLPQKEVREIIPEDIPLDIIHEDQDIIVVNKPIEMIVHPARSYKTGTLVNALVHHFSNITDVGEDFRPGIVHRLDKNTTGCLIVAKNETAHWKLSKQFQARTVKKFYLTIVHGNPELSADRINKPLGIHPHIREKCAVRADGKKAVTIYQVLEEFQGYSLVKLDLRTGRTHQIRVHMSHLGHPIVADDMYGGKQVYSWQIKNKNPRVEEPLMNRVALHAWKLEINHPQTDKRMKFTAELPDDIQKFLNQLRKHRSKK